MNEIILKLDPNVYFTLCDNAKKDENKRQSYEDEFKINSICKVTTITVIDRSIL